MQNNKLLSLIIVLLFGLTILFSFASSIFFVIQSTERGVIFRKFGGGLDKINIPYPQKNIIGGDSKEDSIMAASIIAKVERDKLMDIYARTYPDFGFEKNKGYGTKFHLNALKINEPTPIHRMTFKPLKNKY